MPKKWKVDPHPYHVCEEHEARVKGLLTKKHIVAEVVRTSDTRMCTLTGEHK
jgi:hypothetical protein